MTFRRALGVGIVLVTTCAAPVLAQNRSWHDPYQRALDAVKAKKWADVVTNIDTAVRMDPKSQASKTYEGVMGVADYFPYLYRAQAYFELKEFAKADADLKLAAPTKMSRDAATLFSRLQNDVATALRPVPSPTATPQPTSTPSRTPSPTAPAVAPAFTAKRQAAQTALENNRFGEATAAFEELKAMDAAAFARLGLQPRLDDAVRGQVRELVATGQQRLKDARLSEAKARFTEAKNLSPADAAALAGLAEIDKRERDYQTAKGRAEQSRIARRYQDALQQYAAANAAHPEQYKTDGLAARVDDVNRAVAAASATPAPTPTIDAAAAQVFANKGKFQLQNHNYDTATEQFNLALGKDPKNADAVTGLTRAAAGKAYEERKKTGQALFGEKKYEDARKALQDARDQDGARFAAEGLVLTLEKIEAALKATPEPPSPVALPLRDALVAYLKGDTGQAIGLLEGPAKDDQKLTPDDRADVHAYLGVAYADRALTSRADDDRRKFHDQAIAQFKLALAENPNYQLSYRLGPQVQRLLTEARGK